MEPNADEPIVRLQNLIKENNTIFLQGKLNEKGLFSFHTDRADTPSLREQYSNFFETLQRLAGWGEYNTRGYTVWFSLYNLATQNLISMMKTLESFYDAHHIEKPTCFFKSAKQEKAVAHASTAATATNAM